MSDLNLAAREFFPISTLTSVKEMKMEPKTTHWWVHLWKPPGFEYFPFSLSATAFGTTCREQQPGNNTHSLFPSFFPAHHLWKALTTPTLIFLQGITGSKGNLKAWPTIAIPKGLLDISAPIWAFRYLTHLHTPVFSNWAFWYFTKLPSKTKCKDGRDSLLPS